MTSNQNMATSNELMCSIGSIKKGNNSLLQSMV